MKPVKNRTDQQLKELALQVYKGEIILSSQMSSARDVSCAFGLLFAFAKKKDINFLKKHAAVLYGEISGALPRTAINGLPMFTSFGWLSKGDFARLKIFYDKLKKTLVTYEPKSLTVPPARNRI